MLRAYALWPAEFGIDRSTGRHWGVELICKIIYMKLAVVRQSCKKCATNRLQISETDCHVPVTRQRILMTLDANGHKVQHLMISNVNADLPCRIAVAIKMVYK